jgi:hypothetical protein
MAVLICTMGTLIVLLVIVVRQAKVRADTVAREHVDQRRAAAEGAADLERRRVEREDARWRADMLKQSRDKTATDLEQWRLQLAHIEDHTRRLEDEIKQLVKQKQTLDALSQARVLDHDAVEAELEKLRRRLQQERVALEEMRREVAAQPKSYAIVPYEGPNGTRRRPIYIECRGDRVILQPEGIVLTASDFRRPLGPGNPLASMLRAIREYWARAGGQAGGGDPYPLLIVRPDGAEAYGKCREAMESWDDEFGYELVSSELNLAFPPADPALAAALERTLEQSRRYHGILVAAARARAGGDGRGPYLRAAPSGGGFILEGEPRGSGTGGTEGGRYRAGDAPGDRRFGSGQPGGNDSFAADREGQSGDSAGPHAPLDDTATGGDPNRGFADRRMETPRHHGSLARPSEHSDVGAAEPSGGTFYGGTRPSDTDRAGAVGHSDNTFGVSSAPAADGGPGQCEPLPNMTELRGRNWALPHAARGATGAIRPIRVVCTAQQLTIIPRQGSGEALKTVPLRGSTIEALDEFVSALWQHIEEWGAAGTGMYWKPALHVEVAPGGEKRFEQLKYLLDGSGIEVRQKAR